MLSGTLSGQQAIVLACVDIKKDFCCDNILIARR
jgi:hypothetical protein